MALDALKRDVSEAQKVVGSLFADTYPNDVYQGDGYTIEPRRSTSRTQWRNSELWDALRPALVKRAVALSVNEHGEVAAPSVIAANAIAEVRALANISGSAIRVTVLRDTFGLDPDGHATTTVGWAVPVKRT